MYDAILVPTDGSDGADAAADHAARLAAAFDSDVHVLSVVDESGFSSQLADLDPAVDEQRSVFEGYASEAVERLAARLEDASVACRTAVVQGVPYEAIPAYATEHGIDLVAMGTHGRTGLDRWLLGSVTERVVRTSDVPVLTTRNPPTGERYDRVLLPTDGSEPATAAVEHAIAVADRFDATVHALSVVDVRAIGGGFETGPALPDLIAGIEADCERAVAAVADRCADAGVDAVTDVVEGTPYRAIRTYVDSEDIDLVAMGTHGRTGLGRYLVGSVTERTVRTSDVPVLTVR